MKNHLLLIVLFFSIVSCDKLRNEYYLTDEQKKIIPYNGTETLRFIDNNGDTIEYNGVSYKYTIEESYADDKSGTYDKYDKIECVFYNIADSNFIKLLLVADIINKYGFSVSIYKEITKNNGSENTFFHLTSYLSRDVNSLKGDSLFFDSIEINKNTYYKIYKITDVSYSNKIPPRLKTLYYNNTIGILKFSFENNDNWSIIK